MYPSVKAAWHSFSEPFEGRVHSLYVDVLGLVTTGVGNLVDPVHQAIGLPWKRPDGTLASETEIREQWQRVKNDSQRLKKLHWKYAAELTTIRLTDEDIDELVASKLASNQRELTKWFPAFADFPADAQLAILSMAWAVGPAFAQKFPNFTRAANAGRWWECAEYGKIREYGADGTFNAGVVPRNKANKLCFQNAANVMAQHADPAVLHWPNTFQPQLMAPEETFPEWPEGEDSPPLSLSNTNRPPTIQDALDIARAATRRSAKAQMAIDPEPEELLDPADEKTKPDGFGNV